MVAVTARWLAPPPSLFVRGAAIVVLMWRLIPFHIQPRQQQLPIYVHHKRHAAFGTYSKMYYAGMPISPTILIKPEFPQRLKCCRLFQFIVGYQFNNLVAGHFLLYSGMGCIGYK